MNKLKRLLIGRPLSNDEIIHEKLPKWKALAIFSSDALSSVAYGPEMVVLSLTAFGFLSYGYVAPVSLAILVLLAIVTISYVQVTKANPGGGGSYSVAKGNLGELPALTAASSLFIDYSLTVAVSVSSGTDAIISAFPLLIPYRMELNLLVIFGLLMLINLRGTKESSTAFVFPTYAFILGIFVILGVGTVKAIFSPVALIPSESLTVAPFNWAALFFALKAFSNGCSSMTGVEAISNGVPMFRSPESKNAQTTTVWMSVVLGIMFLGITFLNIHYHFLVRENVTMLSQLAEQVFGRNLLYYYVQATTMLILYLAANTAYNGLPPLMSLLARDEYMPRYLAVRGNRLAFSNGIILLSLVAAALVTHFQGNTEHLISLYAVGVFLSFTISQSGLVVHWFKVRDKGWRGRAIINGFGAVITGLVVIVIMTSKFKAGAWIILVIIPILIMIFKKIHSHYQDMKEQLSLSESFINKHEPPVKHGRHVVIIPISGVSCLAANTIGYAERITSDIRVLYIATNDESYEKIKNKWEQWHPGIDLIILKSEYREIIRPILDYIEEVEKNSQPDDYITVLIPEFETKKWWHRLLHNQHGFILRNLLVSKKNIVVSSVRYHLVH